MSLRQLMPQREKKSFIVKNAILPKLSKNQPRPGSRINLFMHQETKTCQNCQKEFTIEPEDFEFYNKIKVPAPTFCPECRLQRRLAVFNIFNLYKRPCDLCHKDFISMYRSDIPYTVYCPKCWWSDNWNPLSFGRDYDFSRPFFEQFKELLHVSPLLGVGIDIPTTETSPYTNMAGHLKNCYLLFHADFDEDSAYSFYINRSRWIFDSALISLSEFCYDSMHSYRNYRCVGLQSQVTESINCAFLKDCMNCQNCFASANLRNKKYYIFNKPYSKESYFNEIKKWDLGSYKTYQEIRLLAEKHWQALLPKPTMDEFTTNCSGSHVFQSKNCKECFEVVGAEDSKYILMMNLPPIKDCYDVSAWGNNLSRSYDCCDVGEFTSDLKFCQQSGINLYDAEYCGLSYGGNHQFGCVSMKKGEYCIFNKKYSKEKYEELRAKIIEHMDIMPYVDKKGRSYKYGEFFPVEISPFAYNETLAQGFFPLSKEKVIAEGYQWQDTEKGKYKITKKTSDLPDHIKDTPDSILGEIVACQKCGRGFKIIKTEFDFLRRMNLPLPRECPFCRIDEKFARWVKNLRVFKRNCSKCGTEFKTNYPKEEVDYILCKKCYLAEVI